MSDPRDTAHLLVTCPDRPGIIAALTNFLLNQGANVTQLDQHATEGVFFARLQFDAPALHLMRDTLPRAFGEVVAQRFEMKWKLRFAADRFRCAVLVSKHDHALLELLWRWSHGELPIELTAVLSNHPDLEAAVKGFNVPFKHVPVAGLSREDASRKMFDALPERTDLVVLARYMQILSPEVCERFPNRIINIHHSFLPAFIGANPYQQAFERGVKIIGATAHYVTAELDDGPIIDQGIAHVSHRYAPEDLKRLGRDLERQVLARAVLWHAEDRILIHGRKTIIFA
jgi:formyltetrahydrofolate deformylase